MRKQRHVRGYRAAGTRVLILDGYSDIETRV